MIKVLLRTDIMAGEGPAGIRYESFWADLERPLAEEDKTAVVGEIEKTGDGFIQVCPNHGAEPVWIRASMVNLVKFIEAEEESKGE